VVDSPAACEDDGELLRLSSFLLIGSTATSSVNGIITCHFISVFLFWSYCRFSWVCWSGFYGLDAIPVVQPSLQLFLLLLLILHPFNGLFSTTIWVSQHQKGKPFWIYWSDRQWTGSGVSWTTYTSFASRSRQITMPVPYHCGAVLTLCNCSYYNIMGLTQ